MTEFAFHPCGAGEWIVRVDGLVAGRVERRAEGERRTWYAIDLAGRYVNSTPADSRDEAALILHHSLKGAKR